jgi:hypothetical protein
MRPCVKKTIGSSLAASFRANSCKESAQAETHLARVNVKYLGGVGAGYRDVLARAELARSLRPYDWIMLGTRLHIGHTLLKRAPRYNENMAKAHTTPRSQTIDILSSTPLTPFGIFLKSSFPRACK